MQQAKIEVISEGRRPHEADLRGALRNPDAASQGGATPPAGTPAPAPSSEDSGRPPAAAPNAAPNTAQGTDGATPNAAPVDYQLARAVDLLRGVALFSERSVN